MEAANHRWAVQCFVPPEVQQISLCLSNVSCSLRLAKAESPTGEHGKEAVAGGW